jgi:uncharacterized phage protein (TIGR01671 family)
VAGGGRVREIKFRGTDVRTGEWKYGFLVHYSIDNPTYSDGWYIISEIGTHNKVNSKSIGEHTDLKDKNGKEIYEGDIIVCMRMGELVPYKVYTDEETQQDWIESLDGNREVEQLYGFHHMCKVIGNSYENPELLTAPSAK